MPSESIPEPQCPDPNSKTSQEPTNPITPAVQSDPQSHSGLLVHAAPVASPGWSIWLVVAYLATVLTLLLFAVWGTFTGRLVGSALEELVKCCLFGGIGGCLYCLRAVYLNACVRQGWAIQWVPWYLIRPIVSCISGGAAFIFLKAGLLVLESVSDTQSSGFGFLALAFVAGLNVDKFIGKLEDIAQSIWGIEKSRASRGVN